MAVPKWLDQARKDQGVREVKGGENSRILEMHSHTSLHARDDETAWCSSAVNCWMEEAGIKGTGSAAAKSWLDWGVKLAAPQLGCVCVIRQKTAGKDTATGSTSGYHVGLWLGAGDGRVTLFGGNQGDMVKESGFNLRSYEIVGYRWPKEEAA